MKSEVDRIVAKAQADDAFKARLFADPVATLRAEGIDVPEGELSEEALASVGAGGDVDAAGKPAKQPNFFQIIQNIFRDLGKII